MICVQHNIKKNFNMVYLHSTLTGCLYNAIKFTVMSTAYCVSISLLCLENAKLQKFSKVVVLFIKIKNLTDAKNGGKKS